MMLGPKRKVNCFPKRVGAAQEPLCQTHNGGNSQQENDQINLFVIGCHISQLVSSVTYGQHKMALRLVSLKSFAARACVQAARRTAPPTYARFASINVEAHNLITQGQLLVEGKLAANVVDPGNS